MKMALGLSLVLFFVLLLLSPIAQETVLLFVVAGVIPGTSFAVPPLAMLGLLLTGLVFLLSWARRQEFYVRMIEHHKTPTETPIAPVAKTKRASKRQLARQTS